MSQTPPTRSVKIPADERGGWSSDRPRRPGEPERPPRKPDVSVRGRVLAPADRLRYSPGSLLLVVGADDAARERFVARVVEEKSTLLTPEKVQGLIRGKVPDDQLVEKADALLAAAAAKRLASGDSTVVAIRGLDAEERERFVRLAAPHRRPRHLLLLEGDKDAVAEDDQAPLAALRTDLDQARLGAEGFATSLRLGGRTVAECKKIIFAPPPSDD